LTLTQERSLFRFCGDENRAQRIATRPSDQTPPGEAVIPTPVALALAVWRVVHGDVSGSIYNTRGVLVI
jgi:hypothetical protein